MRSMPIALFALLLAACPGGGPENAAQSSPSHTSTTTANPQEVPGNSTAFNPVIPPEKAMKGSAPGPVASPAVEVQLTEYSIDMPSTLKPGATTLRIINSGKENHSFAIVGNGVAQQLSQQLTRGDNAQIILNLKPGSYTVYCPVDGHRGKGMQRTISVQ